MGKLTNQQKLEIVKDYIKGASLVALGIKNNVHPGSIRSILKVRKIPFRGGRKYEFDKTYFDKIDTEEKAYWLGFIYAEGNLHRQTLSIKLHKDDKEHLAKFRTSIKSEHLIKPVKNKDAVVLKISWTHFPAKLKSVGIVPNKHAIITYPNISSNLDMHFIRGFFDGDGWITKTLPKDRINHAWFVGFCSASLSFIKTIISKISCGGSIVKKSYTTKKGELKHSFQLSYSGNRSVNNVLSTLYNNSTFFMSRKHDLYKHFLHHYCNPIKSIKINTNRDKLGRFIKTLKV